MVSVSNNTSPNLPQSPINFGQRAIALRQNLYSKDNPHVPTSLNDMLLPAYKSIFTPVLGREQKVKYRGTEFQIHDFGDYIRFRPKSDSKGGCKAPARARIFFHGLGGHKMHSFPHFPTAKKTASYDRYYKGCLRGIDAQNALSGIEEQPMDIIWHRGFWGEPNDKNLIAHSFIGQNINPNFYRGLFEKALYGFARDDIEKQFGKDKFAPDIFAKSAAFMLEKINKDYKNIDIVTHSMGNATLLEALNILDQTSQNPKRKKTQYAALLTHPVPSANKTLKGANREINRQKSYVDLLKYVRDITYKLLGRDEDINYDKRTPTEGVLYYLLNQAIADGKMTQQQKRIIMRGLQENNKNILKGEYNYKIINEALVRAFPLLDKKILRSKPPIGWQLPFLEAWLLSGVDQDDFTQNRLSSMIALQPFCVSPFFDGKAEQLLDKYVGKNRWKILSGGQDELAPEPEKFLQPIFDKENKNKAIAILHHSLDKDHIQDIINKRLVIVQAGAHSTPVLKNNALHNLVTKMHQ